MLLLAITFASPPAFTTLILKLVAARNELYILSSLETKLALPMEVTRERTGRFEFFVGISRQIESAAIRFGKDYSSHNPI